MQGGSGDVVRITADWVNVSGFLVVNSGKNPTELDSGIFVQSNNNGYDIYLWDSHENEIVNNSYYGIRLTSSSNCSLTNNTCEHNSYGIGVDNSDNCTIENNTCTSNNDYGIYVYRTSDCTITNNTCEYNSFGIQLQDSSHVTLHSNTISENRVGILLTESFLNSGIHNNSIFDNTDFGINATNNLGNTVDATNNWGGEGWGTDFTH